MRILVADDHSVMRRGLRVLLESVGLTVAAEAADGVEALALCQEHSPNVMIVDIGLPPLSGLEVAARALSLERPPAVVLLGTHGDEAYVIRALAAGVRAYLLKGAVDEDLIPAIHAVAAGRPFFSPAVSTAIVDDHARRLRQHGLTASACPLTDREKKVVQLLAEGRSSREVAELLDLGVSAVESHRTDLMRKLGLRSAAELVLFAVRARLIA